MEQHPQLATMDLGYYPNCLDMDLAGNLLGQPCNGASNQPYYYYEPSIDYLLATSQTSTTQAAVYTINAANHFDLAVSKSYDSSSHMPVYAEAATFQPNSIDTDCISFESSVFLSPQTSVPSSAAQSPQAEPQNDLIDLSIIDEILDVNVDDILNNEQFISDDLLDVLNDVGGCGDFLSQLEAAVAAGEQTFDKDSYSTASDSSVSSTPKRKYSTDSSDCYSLDSFETCSNDSKKPKRAGRAKKTKEEKVARKKDQNKKAASRYRNKKKSEVQCHTGLLEELESQRSDLNEQVRKLQTEFSVILPLAKAAFTYDPIRSQHLSQLLSRIDSML